MQQGSQIESPKGSIEDSTPEVVAEDRRINPNRTEKLVVIVTVAFAATLGSTLVLATRIGSNFTVLSGVALTIVAVSFSALFGVKQGFLNFSRTADLNILTFAEVAGDGEHPARQKAACAWLCASEDYRRLARVRGYACVILVFAAMVFVAALIIGLFGGPVTWSIPFSLGVSLYVSALVSTAYGFGYFTSIPWLEAIPLLPQKWIGVPYRWIEIWEVIQKLPWLRSQYRGLLNTVSLHSTMLQKW